MDIAELVSSLRTVVSHLNKDLRKQANSVRDYSMTEIETIMHLFRSAPLLPTELATLTKITTQSMSQILKKMDAQGVIKRAPSKDDKRKVYISLTPVGKKMVNEVKYDADEWLKGAIEKLSDKEKGILVKALPVLNKLM